MANADDPKRPTVPSAADQDRLDDQAVREAIARIMADEAISTRSEAEREARFAAVREQIKAGGYVSDEVIRGAVERLMKDWNL